MEYGHFKRRGSGDFNRSSGGGDNRDRSDNRSGGDFNRGGGGDFNRGGGGGFNRDRGGSRDQGGFRDRSDFDRDNEESVFSKRVRAGKRRTYFLDVRKTRGEDFFITITESTRREDGDGYKRHKIFLYKEDFNRFVASLNEVVEHVKTSLMPDFDYEEFDRRQAEWEAQNREADDMDRTDHRADAAAPVEADDMDRTDAPADTDEPANADDPASEPPPTLKPGKKSAPKEEDDMDW